MNTLLGTLKEATTEDHRRLERRLDLLGSRYQLADYRRVLQAFWGYYQPLEQRLGNAPGLPARVPDLRLRAKTPALVQDLQALGLSPAEIVELPRCTALPETGDEASALGCLYVVEGATLGGQVIGPWFRNNLGVDERSGGRFFSGYGVETQARWQAFGGYCADFPMGAEARTAAVAAARATFQTLEAWLEERGLLRK